MKITVKNKLDLLIKDSGVHSFEEMAQRLTKHQGYKITRTTISRMARNENAAFAISFIEAVCNELNCLPGDLYETIITNADPDYVESIQSRLQPFKYGAIHLSRKGKEQGAIPEVTIPASQPKTSLASVSADPTSLEDMDAVCGPNVSHLSAAKLKK